MDHAVVERGPGTRQKALDLGWLKADETSEGNRIHLPHEEVRVLILCSSEDVVGRIQDANIFVVGAARL